MSPPPSPSERRRRPPSATTDDIARAASPRAGETASTFVSRNKPATCRARARPSDRERTRATSATLSANARESPNTRRLRRPARPRSGRRAPLHELVRHVIARRAEIAQRRIREKIGDAAGVDAGVIFDLLAEARVLGAFAEDRAPVRIERAI